MQTTGMPHLTKLRLMGGLSRRELGERVGVSSVAIYQFETGIAMPSLKTARKLADTLGCEIDHIYPSEANR